LQFEFGEIDYLEGSYESRLNTDSEFESKNRYNDIMVYDDTRVVLEKRPPKQDTLQDTYINAAYVDSPLAVGDRKIIAAQAPLPNTISDFWRMVAQEDVRMIVTVCKLKEGGRTKCELYWPNDSEFNKTHGV
jgi:protein tyrosine phosphatase